ADLVEAVVRTDGDPVIAVPRVDGYRHPGRCAVDVDLIVAVARYYPDGVNAAEGKPADDRAGPGGFRNRSPERGQNDQPGSPGVGGGEVVARAVLPAAHHEVACGLVQDGVKGAKGVRSNDGVVVSVTEDKRHGVGHQMALAEAVVGVHQVIGTPVLPPA